MIKVLVVGNGAREHAITCKLAQSNKISELFAVPGNPGIAKVVKTCTIDYKDIDEIVKFSKKNHINLVVVGPSVPLILGLPDALHAEGIACFGPNQQCAQLASKEFAKAFLKRNFIPATNCHHFSDATSAKNHVEQLLDNPIVIKYDGVHSSGMGRFIAKDPIDAQILIDDLFAKQASVAEQGIIVEEFIDGEELSLLTFVDGQHIVPLLPVQDYKYMKKSVNQSYAKLNGLGMYAPAESYTPSLADLVATQIIQPLEQAVAKEGFDYRGCLHLRILLTEDGPKISDVHISMGDPEIEVLLPILRSDLYEIMMACIDGDLARYHIVWRPEYSVCLIMTSGGYPKCYETGLPITDYFICQDNSREVSWAYHACTKLNNRGKLVTAGGKVVAVSAVGKSFYDALQTAYKRVHQISFKNCYYRPNLRDKEEAQLMY